MSVLRISLFTVFVFGALTIGPHLQGASANPLIVGTSGIQVVAAYPRPTPEPTRAPPVPSTPPPRPTPAPLPSACPGSTINFAALLTCSDKPTGQTYIMVVARERYGSGNLNAIHFDQQKPSTSSYGQALSSASGFTPGNVVYQTTLPSVLCTSSNANWIVTLYDPNGKLLGSLGTFTATGCAPVVSLAGTWDVFDQQCGTCDYKWWLGLGSITQNGTSLTFKNENGNAGGGNIIAPGRLTSDAFGGGAGFNKDLICFDNGSVFRRTGATPSIAQCGGPKPPPSACTATQLNLDFAYNTSPDQARNQYCSARIGDNISVTSTVTSSASAQAVSVRFLLNGTNVGQVPISSGRFTVPSTVCGSVAGQAPWRNIDLLYAAGSPSQLYAFAQTFVSCPS